MRALAFLVLAAAACGGRYPATGAGAGGGSGDDGPRGVEAAALPYSIVEGRTGAAVSEADFWAAVGAARVICVGEDHTNPHHHWAQLEIVDKVSSQRKAGLALGMEMVQRPFQAVLDDFAAGRIDEAALRSRVGWEDRWGYDYALYRPVIAMAASRGAALIALNAARELTKKVVREGLEALTADERSQLPAQIDLDDPDHRAWFDGIMSAMGGAGGHSHTPKGEGEGEGTGEHLDGGAGRPDPDAEGEPTEPVEHRGELAAPPPSADRVYSVQVIWDESMADGAASWVGTGDRAMVVLAGNGHCHDSAIVRRVSRRGVAPALSVRPIIDDGDGNVAAAIQEAHNDYLFVMTMPSP